VAVIPVMAALYLQFPGNRAVATVVYVLAILTDYLDGILAAAAARLPPSASSWTRSPTRR
jgi:phosphatidylglycerophosphate synthase